jgi:hypothetical protein
METAPEEDTKKARRTTAAANASAGPNKAVKARLLIGKENVAPEVALDEEASSKANEIFGDFGAEAEKAIDLGADRATDIETCVVPADNAAKREKFWLDDCYQATDGIYSFLKSSGKTIADRDREATNLLVYSICFEFCWKGEIQLPNVPKCVSAWTPLREHVRDMVLNAHLTASSSAASGTSVAAALLKAVDNKAPKVDSSLFGTALLTLFIFPCHGPARQWFANELGDAHGIAERVCQATSYV